MTDFMNANTINDLIRSVFALLDRVAYCILGLMYEILFNVASADIFSNATIKNFYGRIQLILGVFMIFRLAIAIIKGILEPDSFTDKKSGFGNIITRVVTALVVLTILTPINIPSARTEYEIQLNNNGLLFGTLYSLQTRILENNTLGRLILGTTDNAVGGPTSPDPSLSAKDKKKTRLKQSADIFTSTILKGFIRINMKPDSDMDETNPESRICGYIDQDTLDVYTAYDANPNELLALVNASCEAPEGGFDKVLAGYKRLTGKDKYIFAYMPVISTVVAVIFIWILLGEIITIAIRSLKLAVLRLIAPIPVISYVQPSKDGGAFGAWTKALTSTYLELFLHLAVIYFVIFLIQDMIVNGIVINNGTGIVGVLSFIFICIGLFFFIKQAPKFIMNVLGIKSQGNNIGLATLMGGAAMALGGGGAKGFALGALNAADASTKAVNQGKAYGIGDSWNQNSDLMAKIRTGDKDAQGGALGRLHDRLDYTSRERRARFLGIGNQDLADSKYIKDVREAQALTTKKELDLAKAAYEAVDPADTAAKAAAQARYEAAYDKNETYQAAAAKAAKTYDQIDKDRANFGVTPRVSDKRRDKHSLTYKFNGEKYDDAPDGHILREGTYRSPLTTNNDSKESIIGNKRYADLPDKTDAAGQTNRDILDESTGGATPGHKRDLKNFNGTTDDEFLHR